MAQEAGQRFIGTAATDEHWACALLDGGRLRVFLRAQDGTPVTPAMAQDTASGLASAWPDAPVALELYDLADPSAAHALLAELAPGATAPAVWNDDSAPLSPFRLLSALRTLTADATASPAPDAKTLTARASQRSGLFPQPLASVNINRWGGASSLDRAALAADATVPAKLSDAASPQAVALRAVELAHAIELLRLLEPTALAPDLSAVTLTAPDAAGAARNLLLEAEDEPLAPLPEPVARAFSRIRAFVGAPAKNGTDFSGANRLWVPLYRADDTESGAYLELGRLAAAPTGGRYDAELLRADRAEGRLAPDKLVPWAPRYRTARPFSGWELDFGDPLGLRGLFAERLGRFSPGALEELQAQATENPGVAWMLDVVRRSPDVAENRGASAALAAKLLMWRLAQSLEMAACPVEAVASGRILCGGSEATVAATAAALLEPWGVPFSIRPIKGAVSGTQELVEFTDEPDPTAPLVDRALAAILRERSDNIDEPDGFSRPATELEALAELQDAAEGLSPRELVAATQQVLTSTEKTPLVLVRDDGVEAPMPPGSVRAWPVMGSSGLSPWHAQLQRAKSRGQVPGIGGASVLVERRPVTSLPDDRVKAIAAGLDLTPLAQQVVKEHHARWM